MTIRVKPILLVITVIFFSYFSSQSVFGSTEQINQGVELHILGVAQDAGYPQINCYQPHCMPGWLKQENKRDATALALIDRNFKKKYLFEATPDLPKQLYQLHRLAADTDYSLSGVFLTHAHIGHYTGLMYFGREAAGAENVPVYAMPRMRSFLKENAPWSQLITLNNISLHNLVENSPQQLTKQLNVTPFIVPHRDEFSETVGYTIRGPNKTALFIPDIDKWTKWQVDIKSLILSVDYAFLDGTFFNNKELPNRDMNEVPHPFVIESMQLLNDLPSSEKNKIYFIHFNHSNPLLNLASKEAKLVLSAGFHIAASGMNFSL